MNTFFVSDTHFNHASILKYTTRPWKTLEEMNEGLIANWNAVVRSGDLVYHLGDVVMGPRKLAGEFLSRLNGRIFLVQGNHDTALPRERFVDRVDFKEIRMGGGNRGQLITLCHFSLRVWNKNHYGAWALFGHSHGGLEPWGKSVDVGVDSPWVTGKAEYRPFHYDEVKAFMDKQEIKVVDHHGVKPEPEKHCITCGKAVSDSLQPCIGEYTFCIGM